MATLVALEGLYRGQPASRERLAELLGRTPTTTERGVFKRLRSALGSDPTLEEFTGYRDRMKAKPHDTYN